MATALRFVGATTVPSAGPATTYRDLVFVDRWGGGPVGVQTLITDTAAGPTERPFREGGAGSAISFYSERVASEFTLAGAVTIQLSGFASDAAFTGRFRLRLSRITYGGSDIETYIGMADATADLTTSTVLYTLAALTPPAGCVIAANERLIIRISVIPTGAGGTSFGTGTATHRYNLFSSGVSLTETVTFLANGTTLRPRRTTVSGIGTFRDLLDTQGSTPWLEARTFTTAGGTEITWTERTQADTVAVTELTAAAIASTTNATTYVSASFTPVANRLYLLAVLYSDAAAETTEATIATTTGLTFVALADHTSAAVSVPFDTIASNAHKIKLFRAMKASGLSAGTYTVTFGDAATGCAALLVEVTGVKTTGTDGADAVRDTTMTAGDGSANPFMLGSLPEGPLEPYNGYFTCVGSTLQTAPTPGTGMTGLSHPDYATPASGLFAQWSAANTILDTGAYPACTLASSNWGLIQVELVAAQNTVADLAWISPRVQKPWLFSSVEHCAGSIATYVTLNDGLANTGARVKLFHRAPDGTETLVYTNSSTAEVTETTSATPVWNRVTQAIVLPWTPTSGTLNQAMAFHEDDRVVLRVYLINIGTMATGYTVNLPYDHNVSGVTVPGTKQDARFTLYTGTTWKAEADPAATGHVEGGQTMGGVGN